MPANPTLDELIELARKVPVTPEMRREQIISFVWGSLCLRNVDITRKMIEAQYDKLERERRFTAGLPFQGPTTAANLVLEGSVAINARPYEEER